MINTIWAYLRGFRRERRESARILKEKNVEIGELQQELRQVKRDLRTEKRAGVNKGFLAAALDRYNEASRARVYPGADVDKQRDVIRMLRDSLIQEMAYTRYLSENLPEEVVPFNDLPEHVRKGYFRAVEERVES